MTMSFNVDAPAGNEVVAADDAEAELVAMEEDQGDEEEEKALDIVCHQESISVNYQCCQNILYLKYYTLF